jgi:hypothetical protein
MSINDIFVTLIKVYPVYQAKHVHHAFRVNEVIEVSQVHPVFQAKKENQ